MTKEEFDALPDITPAFGYMERTIDGRRVRTPLLEGEVGALFIGEDQGEYTDADGSRWLVGTHSGQVVKRRFA